MTAARTLRNWRLQPTPDIRKLSCGWVFRPLGYGSVRWIRKAARLRYISTRGEAPELEFDDVLLAGLARDGGLYVPEDWPKLDENTLRSLRGLPYAQLAARVLSPFVGDRIREDDFADLVSDAYETFDHDAIAPLKQLDPSLWLMELFHGPTLAFKDFAMQLLARLFDHVIKKRGERITLIGATSGDTGSAAIEACRGTDSVDIFILFPDGRVSEVQRRQMTTVQAPNVHTIAIEGTFDDCQDLVKAMFNDLRFRDEMRLSAVNSINWCRVMAQIVYYVHAALSLGAPDRPVSFSVPTGNFGNVFAGYAAGQMGLPIDQLIVGSNANDILTRFFADCDMSIKEVVPTLSPSMDIQVSSNFERLLFELCGHDGDAVSRLMEAFRRTGRLDVDREAWALSRELFDGHAMDDNATKTAIKAFANATGEIVDPHTAIGLVAAAARRRDPAVPVVALATAHPAKFPDAVTEAVGRAPALPRHLEDLYQRDERMAVLPNDRSAIQGFIRDHVDLRGAA